MQTAALAVCPTKKLEELERKLEPSWENDLYIFCVPLTMTLWEEERVEFTTVNLTRNQAKSSALLLWELRGLSSWRRLKE
jgi:hypothetical protein